MRITKLCIKNLGPIDQEGNLRFGKLTILMGDNNLGKTYLTYTLYGILKLLKNYIKIDLKLDEMLVDSNIMKLNLTEFLRDINQELDNATNDFIANSSDDVFGDSPVNLYQNTELKIEYSQPEIKKLEFKYTNDEFEFSKTSGQDEVVIIFKNYEELKKAWKKESWKKEYFINQLNKRIISSLTDHILGNSFILSAERTGTQIFIDMFKNIDQVKNKIRMISRENENLLGSIFLSQLLAEVLPLQNIREFIQSKEIFAHKFDFEEIGFLINRLTDRGRLRHLYEDDFELLQITKISQFEKYLPELEHILKLIERSLHKIDIAGKIDRQIIIKHLIMLANNPSFNKNLIFRENEFRRMDRLIDDISYPMPIKDNINFNKTELQKLVKQESFLYNNALIQKQFENMAKGKYIYDDNAKEIQFRPDGYDKSLDLKKSSSSVRALTMLNFYINNIAQKDDLLIIDEPELNLHIGNQRKLARLIGILINQGINIFITTHSTMFAREINNLIRKSALNIDENDEDFGAALNPDDVIMHEIININGKSVIKEANRDNFNLGFRIENFNDEIMDSIMKENDIIDKLNDAKRDK